MDCDLLWRFGQRAIGPQALEGQLYWLKLAAAFVLDSDASAGLSCIACTAVPKHRDGFLGFESLVAIGKVDCFCLIDLNQVARKGFPILYGRQNCFGCGEFGCEKPFTGNECLHLLGCCLMARLQGNLSVGLCQSGPLIICGVALPMLLGRGGGGPLRLLLRLAPGVGSSTWVGLLVVVQQAIAVLCAGYLL